MKPLYLMFSGLSLSGKTFLKEKIINKYPKVFFVLDSRSIHAYLNQFEIFQDDNSIEGEAYEMRQEATDVFQKNIVTVVTKRGYSVIHDSCNRRLKERNERLELVKSLNPDIKTLIIFVNPDKSVVKRRAEKEDNALIKKNIKPVWVDLFNKQVEGFENPSKSEADYFIEFEGKDEKKIFKYLENILGK